MSELFPACVFCNKIFNSLQISLGSDDKIIDFETPETQTIKPGDLSNFL